MLHIISFSVFPPRKSYILETSKTSGMWIKYLIAESPFPSKNKNKPKHNRMLFPEITPNILTGRHHQRVPCPLHCHPQSSFIRRLTHARAMLNVQHCKGPTYIGIWQYCIQKSNKFIEEREGGQAHQEVQHASPFLLVWTKLNSTGIFFLYLSNPSCLKSNFLKDVN